MRVHKLQNVQNALDFLQVKRRIKLVNIRNDEIVDGNQKLILGLIWTLILHFQVHSLKRKPRAKLVVRNGEGMQERTLQVGSGKWVGSSKWDGPEVVYSLVLFFFCFFLIECHECWVSSLIRRE